MKILDNVYGYVWDGTGNNCNTFVLAGEVNILVDPGHVVNEMNEPCYQRLLQSLAADGFRPEDIGLILNTHTHPDHCEANYALRQESKAKLAFHQGEQELLTKLFQFFTGQSPQFQPDFYLTEGDLTIGKNRQRNLKVFHTPGHSPGSVCLYLPEEKVLITGDLIFAMSIGRTDIPGGDFDTVAHSVQRMSELEIEHLLPGHMDTVHGRENVERNFRYIHQVFFA